MDWKGQKMAEQLMQLMLVSFAAAAFVTGYVLGSFQMMLLIYAAGVVLTSLITIPNWSFFNRHPLNWLDPIEADKHPKPQAATASAPKKKSSHRKAN
ncbi:signal peptidase complex subunit 1-like [Andrographis paniculata]|uniref:signal peptidase complex subunit 1-like n=1 Tax=Andrographis paniculata TaxID=175694 RepID=UPI0021E804E1|nr:signal peptidase complex subunit 1-like [Andrographis paniculata]